MEFLFTIALPTSFSSLWKVFSFPCHKGMCTWFTMAEDPVLQSSADLNKPIFVGEISGCLFQVNILVANMGNKEAPCKWLQGWCANRYSTYSWTHHFWLIFLSGFKVWRDIFLLHLSSSLPWICYPTGFIWYLFKSLYVWLSPCFVCQHSFST